MCFNHTQSIKTAWIVHKAIAWNYCSVGIILLTWLTLVSKGILGNLIGTDLTLRFSTWAFLLQHFFYLLFYFFPSGGATGSNIKDIVADVQRYNSDSESWQQVAPLPHPERGAVAANLDGKIYVIGKGKSVICYNRL